LGGRGANVVSTANDNGRPQAAVAGWFQRAQHPRRCGNPSGSCGWRQIALGEKLGVPKALGLTTQEWVEQRLGGYVKLSIAERHGAISELKQEGFDQRRIAAITGVSEATISGDVSELKPKDPVDAIAALAVDAAKQKQDKRGERDRRLREVRAEAEQAAEQTIAELGEQACRIEVADLREWRPQGVQAIVSDPPYITADRGAPGGRKSAPPKLRPL
jgi:predicted transcriptional regulator